MSGKQCPHCGSSETEYMAMLEIIDQVDEDETVKYYWALHKATCLSCGQEFTYEGTYTEVKVR